MDTSILMDRDLVYFITIYIAVLIIIVPLTLYLHKKGELFPLLERFFESSNLLRLFFLRDSTYGSSESVNLRRKIELLEEKNKDNSTLLKNIIENKQVDEQLDNEVKNILESYIEDEEKLNSVFSRNIGQHFKNNFESFYLDFDKDDFINSEHVKYDAFVKERDYQKLLDIQVSEYESASRLRNVMINVFSAAVLVMILSFLVIILFKGSIFSLEKYVIVISLFLSLGFFVIYIIKASNSRTLAIMSIYENQRNHQNLIKWVTTTRSQEGLSEIDVEIARMILINHSEREGKVSHPYEIILKGLTNSNIQFSGGKMSVEKNSETKED